MTEISECYRALAAEFTRRVETAPADRWENPSPCQGWSARDVLRHVIDTHQRLTTLIAWAPTYNLSAGVL